MWNAGWLGKAAWASEPLMLASATAVFFRADGSRRRHHQADRGRGYAANLVQYRATVIPVLFGQCWNDFHGQRGESSPRRAVGLGAGQTIGLLESGGGYNAADISDYFTTNKGIGPGYTTPALAVRRTRKIVKLGNLNRIQ